MRARGRRACGEALWHVAIVALRTRLPAAKMSQNGCGCNGPVVVSAFGAGVPDLQTLSITLPTLQLSDAALHGHLHCLRYLLEMGCETDESASAYAAMGGHLGVCEAIVDVYPEGVLKRDNNGRTPLDEAREGGHEVILLRSNPP